MSTTFKKISALFILSIFLFAYTEKSVHDVIHGDEPHCNAQHEKHFHTQEHHCFICDFDISVFDGSTTSVPPSFTRFGEKAPFICVVSNIAYSYSTASLSRGPPALA
jgi:hypothetical protein